MRDGLSQGWFKRKKVIIADIRMKHNLAAEDEMNEVLSAEAAEYWNAVNSGRKPKPYVKRAPNV